MVKQQFSVFFKDGTIASKFIRPLDSLNITNSELRPEIDFKYTIDEFDFELSDSGISVKECPTDYSHHIMEILFFSKQWNCSTEILFLIDGFKFEERQNYEHLSQFFTHNCILARRVKFENCAFNRKRIFYFNIYINCDIK